jgi:hypothetical protein
MKIRIQMVIEDSNSISTKEVTSINRESFDLGQLGLKLQESKQILLSVQQTMVESQVQDYLHQQKCLDCGKTLKLKGKHKMDFNSLFGKVVIDSPRFYCCPCKTSSQKSFSPLTQALEQHLEQHISPELQYLQSKWASLVSYGVTLDLLEEVLPINSHLNKTSIQRQVHKTAQRIEDELGEQKWEFISDWKDKGEVLPTEPLAVGLDGCYVTSKDKKGRRDGCFELIVGKSIGAERETKCFGFLSGYDKKAKRRLYEVLKSQGLEKGQPVTFFSDGGATVRSLPVYLYSNSEHLLDWFHITMRLTVLGQMAKGIPTAGNDPEILSDINKELESLKWHLWHGHIYRALDYCQSLESWIECLEEHPNTKKLLKTMKEFTGYILANQSFIPNYGDRYRYGERISTAFVESTLNQVVSKRFVKKQQMQCSKQGAHLLLQTRTKVLNNELYGCFSRWFPSLNLIDNQLAA